MITYPLATSTSTPFLICLGSVVLTEFEHEMTMSEEHNIMGSDSSGFYKWFKFPYKFQCSNSCFSTPQVNAQSCAPNDFQWLVDRTSIIYLSGDCISGTLYPVSYTTEGATITSSSSSASTGLPSSASSSGLGASGGGGGGGGGGGENPWLECMSVFMHPDFVVGRCPTAVSHAWPILFARLRDLEDHVGPK
jgi:uncharacterized membrane protein YgcG